MAHVDSPLHACRCSPATGRVQAVYSRSSHPHVALLFHLALLFQMAYSQLPPHATVVGLAGVGDWSVVLLAVVVDPRCPPLPIWIHTVEAG
jgi:hypothetical protein